MLTMTKPYLLLIAMTVSSHATSGIEVIEEDTDIRVRTDEELNLSCTGSDNWAHCRWSFNNESCSQNVTDCKIREGVSWQGMPLVDNTCSISIANPTKQDAGAWTCQLIKFNKNKHIIASKSFKVSVYSKAQLSFGSRPHQWMAVGHEYNIECVASNGVPKPKILALVGPSKMSGDKDELLEVIKFHEEGILGGTVSKMFKYSPDRGPDLELYVKCMALQRDEDGLNVFDPQMISNQFKLGFSPLPNEDPVQQFYLNEGGTTEVTINFYAHPPPSNEQVVWHVVRGVTNESFTMTAGSARGRFETSGVTVGVGGAASVTAYIHQSTYDDIGDNYYYLEVSNNFGRNHYDFELLLPPMTTVSSVDEEEDEGGKDLLSVGAIVGIAVGALLFIIAIAILESYPSTLSS